MNGSIFLPLTEQIQKICPHVQFQITQVLIPKQNSSPVDLALNRSQSETVMFIISNRGLVEMVGSNIAIKAKIQENNKCDPTKCAFARRFTNENSEIRYCCGLIQP